MLVICNARLYLIYSDLISEKLEMHIYLESTDSADSWFIFKDSEYNQ